MKKMLTAFLLFSFAQIGFCQDQDNGCKLILQNGLYKYYLHHSTGTYEQDLKTYFASDKFKSDYKNNKWSGSIGVVVDAVPISLGANSDDSQISTFQNQVRQATSFSTSSSFDEIAIVAIPDVGLAKVYKDCVTEPNRSGFKIYPIVSENNITFMINYKKDNSNDSMPKVTFFQIKNGINVQNQLIKGEVIRDNMTVTCDRNPDDDVTLILETDRKTATLVVPAEPIGFNKDFPVGTIITSYLNFDQFNGVTKNNEKSPDQTWSSQFSKYAPCDGREVPNSAFVKAASVLNVPDLRGVFLRGLNQFDLNETSIVDNNRMNPENKKVGEFQEDLFKKHNHNLFIVLGWGNWTYGGNNWAVVANLDHPDSPEKFNEGGAETRPKNVSIYYYIRIN